MLDVPSPVERLLRHALRGRLDADDTRTLLDAVEDIRDLDERQVLIRAGQPLNSSTLLLEGFITRYLDDRHGGRQLVSIHVPGDFVDLHGFPTRCLEHDVATLTRARVAVWSHEALRAVIEPRPRLMELLWYVTLVDAAVHREWIFRLGRLGAAARVAHLICELQARLARVELALDTGFSLPLTQVQVAEACGLTHVHLNRVLRKLREDGVMSFRGQNVVIDDLPRLQQIGEFDAAYLRMEPR